MPIPQDSDIGPRYDLLIATRDGSTLPCLDRNRRAQSLNAVAYVCSTNPQTPTEEATEIQRKDQLTQLSSAQVIDRDFDAWPQVEQGNWQDGQGQRVFSGQGEAVGTISNKSTAYWDGLGVLWPITDYLPQGGYTTNPEQAEPAIMRAAGNGVTGGNFVPGSVTTSLQSFAYAYMRNSDGHNILAIRTPAALRKIDPIPNSTNGTPYLPNGSLTGIDYVFALGYLWLATTTGVGAVVVNAYADGAPPPVAFTTTITPAAGTSSAAGVFNVRLAVARVASKSYLAVLYVSQSLVPTLQVYDLSSVTFGASAAPVPLGGPNNLDGQVLQVEFQGDNILYAVTSGQRGHLVQFNIASQTHTTLAEFPNCTNVLFTPIAGGVFILAANDTALNGIGNTVDMYLFQGGGLQHIGPVQVQTPTVAVSNAIAGETEPVAFGPYAVFAIYYRPVSQATTSIQVFAYDVLRGRLFKIQDIGGYNIFLGAQMGRRMSIAAPVQYPVPAGTFNAEWMVGVPTLSQSNSAQDVTNVQNMMVGVSTSQFGTALLQQGTQITSSLIDFTSGQNKLYRQVVASFTPLPADTGITVRLDAWLDQDPSNLTAIPDFTTGVVAAGLNGGLAGQSQLNLIINKVARKLVYRVTTTGPSTITTPAVKLVSIAIQVATGWSWHLYLAMSGRARLNNDQDYCFTSQGLGVDELSAYNFLRQLWRLRGGECVVSLPNGDKYNAIIQLISGKSPKPFGVSYLSDQPNTYQEVVELKFREDV